MNKIMKGGLGALLAATTVLSAVPASAQYYGGGYRDSDRDGRPDYREWNRDRDRDGRPDQWDRRDDRRDWRRDWRHRDRHYRFYGDRYGYDGYRGTWRSGMRYPYWRDNRYVVYNYSDYGLPAPRPGYRYYRSNNGDIVMAAVATGIIGLIVGSALAR